MAPPLHVKAISALLNTVVMIAGARNVFMPGTPVIVIPEDDAFQEHFFKLPVAMEIMRSKMTFIFQLFGCFMLMAASTKLIMVFTTKEGTFLRQKLFFALGTVDLLTAAVVLMYKGMPQSVTMGIAGLHALEGVAFLADAAFRVRPVKDEKKKGK